MSLVLAVRSNHAVVVATDSQRVEADGRSSAPFDKAFRVGRQLLVAYAGLLEFDGLTVQSHLATHLASARTPDAAAATVETLLLPLLQGIPETEVGFVHRRLDVMVASRAGIHAVGFFPQTNRTRIDVRHDTNRLFLVTGDPPAHQAAHRSLDTRSRTISVLQSGQLRDLARAAADIGIAACGPHPSNASLKACCGPVRILSIPDSNAA